MDNETKTASEMWDIMEELGIAVDKSFFEPWDLTPPTLEELLQIRNVIFKSITDWKEAAKWLSKWSTMIATPIITNKTNDYVTKDTKQVNRGE